MNRCSRCDGFVPQGQGGCPNCRSSARWWKAPLALAGAGFTMVTLSACYGAPCAGQVILPDGGTVDDPTSCFLYDCRADTTAGTANESAQYKQYCKPSAQDGGSNDGGTP